MRAFLTAALAVVSAALVSATMTAADSEPHVLASRFCRHMPSGPDPNVRDEIYRVALSVGVNAKVMLAMMATAITESWVNNLNCGDKDSLGVFQQRASMNWGTPEQLMNVEYATKAFLRVCIPLDRKFPNIDAGVLAQKVQIAEAGNQYTKNLDLARHYIDLAAASIGKPGPKPTTIPRPDPDPTPTKTEDGDGKPTSTNTKPSQPQQPPATPKPTEKDRLPFPAPPLATLVSPDGAPMKVLVMPSAAVGRVDPVMDASGNTNDRKRITSCARAEYARPGDGCETFAQRYGIGLDVLRDLNPSIDAACSNLHVRLAWCIEAAPPAADA